MKKITIKKIEELVSDSKPLEEILSRDSEEHIRWVRKVSDFLEKTLGSEAEEVRTFSSLSWVEERSVVIGGPDRPRESWNPQLGIDRVNREAYGRHLKIARRILLSVIDRIEEEDKENKEKVALFHSELIKAMTLGEAGVLTFEEYEALKSKAETIFDNELAEYRDEVSYRKFQALRRGGDWIYRETPKPGAAGVESGKLKILSILEELLRDVASLEDESLVEDIHIYKGGHFEARKAVRWIIEQASEKIIIVDSYLDPTVLKILELFVSENPTVEVRLLASSKSGAKFTALAADLEQFKKTYPASHIDLRDASAITHDRYIIIDGDLFHLGHSIRNLGDATSRISKVSNPVDTKKMIQEIEDIWMNSTPV